MTADKNKWWLALAGAAAGFVNGFLGGGGGVVVVMSLLALAGFKQKNRKFFPGVENPVQTVYFWGKFTDRGRQVVAVGVNFDSVRGQITDWISEKNIS